MRIHIDHTQPRLKHNTIFVFGSNLAGRHGKGAAKAAHDNYGARHGIGVGQVGNSYAIPTKDAKLVPLPLNVIAVYAEGLCDWVLVNPDLDFHMTRFGCDLAGYKDEQIAPMLAKIKDAPNVSWTQAWADILQMPCDLQSQAL
jgi:hypothetical protein